MWESLISIFLEKNNQLNLGAIRDHDWVMTKHVLDSIELNSFFELEKWKTVCDIWTGWWFPLLPLSITNPDVDFTWLDARRKKVDAVNEMIEKLGIKNANAYEVGLKILVSNLIISQLELFDMQIKLYHEVMIYWKNDDISFFISNMMRMNRKYLKTYAENIC